MLDVVPLVFLSLTLAVSLFFAYNYKNAFMLLFSGIASILLAVAIWTGGMVKESGLLLLQNTTGNATNQTISAVTTKVYTVVNFGFAQRYIAVVFAVLGLFLFLQAIGAFANGGKTD